MKAMKNWMNKPWTWGTYFKLSGIVAGKSTKSDKRFALCLFYF